MHRFELINNIVDYIKATNYLEIGIDSGDNFKDIICDNKIGVDPNINAPCLFHMTSDDFFEQNKDRFDVIFIDGLHHADFVERDILSSLSALNDGGYIICHDMNPTNEIMQRVPREVNYWMGDCWKAWVKLRSTVDNLSMYVVDTDCGCGIITRGRQDLLNINCELTYENFDINKKEWLNLISIDEFKLKLGQAL